MVDPHEMRRPARYRWRLAAWACALAVSACGGGGDGEVAGVSTGGTGSWSNGNVREMGSIVVGEVHFDQFTASTVVDGDGRPYPKEDIDVGMNVEVVAETVIRSPGGRQDARSLAIRVTSDLLGPVTEAAADGFLQVMGQKVRLLPGTLLRKKIGSGWSAIDVGDILRDDIVEVYGHHNAEAKEFVATRVEWRGRGPGVVSQYVVRGVIEDFTKTGCRIGTQEIRYDWPTAAEGQLDGKVGRAVLYAVTPSAPVKWGALAMDVTQPLVADRGDARLEGLVTEHLTPKSFSINGVPVQTDNACSECLRGVKVRVRGVMKNAVLKAERAELLP